MTAVRTVIIGAAGRDFHNFNMKYRDDPAHEIVAFTAAQIPNISGRRYPSELAGPRYPGGIPIHPETELERVIREFDVGLCVLSYSDLSHIQVGHLASRVNAAGADFVLLGTHGTLIHAAVPVISVCAARTGAGKSQTSREIVRLLREMELEVGVIRHPMPYGDLVHQRVQRFATAADLEAAAVTIEEREEYEPHIAMGSVVWAGVDYRSIVHAAEREAQVLVWDGGNNDTSFLVTDLYVTVADPLRAGHEISYYPGETNLRLADLVIINKANAAGRDAVQQVRRNVHTVNPAVSIIEADSHITIDRPEQVRGKRVLAIEDGPTLTHGGMAEGAACAAARELGAILMDPRPFARGEIRKVFEEYPHIGHALPAMGYGPQQLGDLEATVVAACEAGVEAVLVGTPVDLPALIRMPVPVARVRYELRPHDVGHLMRALAPVILAAREQSAVDVEC